MATLGDELRELERQVDAMAERPYPLVPPTVRAMLRSASGILMTARWVAEDSVPAEVDV